MLPYLLMLNLFIIVFGGGGSRRGGSASGCLFWIVLSVGTTIFINLILLLIPSDLTFGLGYRLWGQRLNLRKSGGLERMPRQWVVLLILVCTGLSGADFMWNLFEPVPLYWRTLRGAGHTPVQTPATHEL